MYLKVSLAYFIDGLIVNEKGDVCGLQAGVCGQDGVVGLNDGRCHVGRGINHKLQLGLLAVVRAEVIHEEGGEAGSGAAAEGMEHNEALEPDTVLRHVADAIHRRLDLLLA